MALDIEGPLDGFHRTIGGSAGQGTHGGPNVQKPDDMPDVSDADYKVTNWQQLDRAVREDGATVYVADNIDVTNKGPVPMGDGVTLFSDYCNPDTDNLIGPYLYHRDTSDDNYSRVVFTHRGGEPVTLYGIYALGPRLNYTDPDHESDAFADLQCSFLHEYAEKDTGLFEAIGCRFTGWTFAGLELGAKSYETRANVHRCTFERNNMEHLGYGIQHYNGDLWIDKCFFDKCRHGFAGFGYPNETIDVTNTVFGPGLWSGHCADMHCLANNLSTGDDTAGKHLRIRNCSFMGTQDVGGYGQEGVAIRGISVNESQIWNCDFWHDSAPDAPGEQGSAVRQESGTDSWENLRMENNTYGNPMSNPNIGAPHADPSNDSGNGESDDNGDGNDGNGGGGTDGPSMTKPYQTLRVTGTSRDSSTYVIHISGGAKQADDDTDDVTTADDGTVINGAVASGGTDTFTLSSDARLESVWFNGATRVTVDDELIQLTPLVTTYMDTQNNGFQSRQ